MLKELILVLSVLVCLVVPAGAEEMKGSMSEMMNDAEETGGMEMMMEKFQKYSTPGEHHQALGFMVGDWTTEVSYWMMPGTEAEVSQGTSYSEWIMDGRFVQTDFQGESMGMPFEGRGIIGYDNLKQKYVSVWLDNMGTGIMTSTGSKEADAMVFSETGSFSCPMIDGERYFRGVTTVQDDNHYTYEMFVRDDKGVEFRSMLITYTRN